MAERETQSVPPDSPEDQAGGGKPERHPVPVEAGPIDLPWLDAYFEARLAFSDLPGARILTTPDQQGYVKVVIRERVSPRVTQLV